MAVNARTNNRDAISAALDAAQEYGLCAKADDESSGGYRAMRKLGNCNHNQLLVFFRYLLQTRRKQNEGQQLHDNAVAGDSKV